MGGLGSGNWWREPGRPSVDEFRAIDVRWLARKGILKSTGWANIEWSRDGKPVASVRVRGDTDRIHLWYRHSRNGGPWTTESYAVRVVQTACHLGGSRAWFICPAVRCGRRVAKLFGGEVFACRHCYRLAYPSTREDAWDRATRRADIIRDRLGWKPGVLNGMGRKPKWMRWKTYDRLTGAHDDAVQIWVVEMKKRFAEGGADA